MGIASEKVGQFLIILNTNLACDSWVCIPERHNLCSYKIGYTFVYTVFIDNSETLETTQMSINSEWIRKPWYIHTKEYHSVTKRKSVNPMLWMDLK